MNPQMMMVPIFVAAFALGGCGDDRRERRTERGPVVTETRDVGEFDSVALRGSAQLRIQVGPAPSLTLEGDQRSLDRVSTEVDGDTLHIRGNRKDWVFSGGRSRLVVNITVPKLAELKLEGGNDVKLAGFSGGTSRIDIEGAANLEAKGTLDELTVHMAGAGHANLRELIASDATVTVDGVGSVYVHSTNSLDATMNGVGAILYSGTPRDVNTSMNGVGTISKDRERRGNEEHTDEEPAEPQLERDDSKPIDPESLQPEYDKKDVAQTGPIV